MTNQITITIADKTITARKIKVKDLPQVGAAINPFIEQFDHIANGEGMTTKALIKLCMDNVDDFVRLCVVMTDAKKEWLENLEPDEFYKLVDAVINISHDFFLTKCESALTGIVNSLNKATATMVFQRLITGLNRASNDLSQAVTSAPTL